MCQVFGVGDLALAARLPYVYSMLADCSRLTTDWALLDGCTVCVPTVALLFVVLTVLYVFLVTVMIALAVCKLLPFPIAIDSDGVLRWCGFRANIANIDQYLPAEDAISALEQACPVRDHTAPDARCAVCLDSMVAGDATRTLPCGHPFHRSCIDAWIGKGGRQCPLCNAAIIPSDSSDVSASPATAAEEAASAAASAAAAVANAVATAPGERRNGNLTGNAHGNAEVGVRIGWWRRRIFPRFRRRRLAPPT